jgi:hypothetical protein
MASGLGKRNRPRLVKPWREAASQLVKVIVPWALRSEAWNSISQSPTFLVV